MGQRNMTTHNRSQSQEWGETGNGVEKHDYPLTDTDHRWVRDREAEKHDYPLTGGMDLTTLTDPQLQMGGQKTIATTGHTQSTDVGGET